MAAEADCECPACGLQQVETRPFNTGIDPVKGATVATTTSTITDQFLSRTQGSARLAERARKVFPGGLTHDSRYLQPYPLYVTHAAGSHKWDVDGHEYVDYSGGHGALLLGHNHPKVATAVAAQLGQGTHFGACHELEVRWGEIVQRLIPSAERVRFTSSGTEATLLAVRLVRAFTGKPKIIRFPGHFHGWHDHMAFAVSNNFDGAPTPGVLGEVAENVLLARPNDVAQVREMLARDDIAGVIIEPTGASWGQVPVTPAFLTALRELTAARKTPLIFDEVISGFRCAPGGAQGALGITPDMTTLAKIIAGGLPGGAVVGRKDILDALDFAAAGTPRGKVPHQGTYNANPVSAAAGIATLEIVATTDACQRANDYAARLREAMRRAARDEQVDWVIYGTYSGFHINTNPNHLPLTAEDIEAGKHGFEVLKAGDKSLITKMRLAMTLDGVDIFSWPGGPTSAVHTNDDLEKTVDAFRHALVLLREEGAIA